MTLYRKYRPQTFSQVLGQPQVTEVISRAVTAGQPAHAYLFAGPRGTGKTSVARILAKSLNCLNKKPGSAEPCNKCDNCLNIDKGTFLDVLELDAASNRGIDEIRQLKEQVAVSPAMGLYKIYILDEAHMLTDAAFNALLKTLEEPPSKVIFILCTTEAHKIPVTIASRCQRLTFSRASLSELVEQLQVVAKAEKVAIEESALSLLANLADGGYRDAEMLLEQVIAGADGKKSISRQDLEKLLGIASQQHIAQLVGNIAQQQHDTLVEHIEDFASQGGNIIQLNDALLEQFRLLMLVSVNPDLGQKVPAEDLALAKKIASQLGQGNILKIIDALLRSRQALQHYQGQYQPLVLETALLEVLQVPEAAISRTPISKDPSIQSQPTKPTPTPTQSVATKVQVSKDLNSQEDAQEVPHAPVRANAQPPVDLADMWTQILDIVRPQSRSVEALLRDCLPVSFDGTILVLQFWYVFHKNKLDLDKNRQLVEQAASQVAGAVVKIESQLGDKTTKPKRQAMAVEDIHNVADVEEQNLVEAAVDIFGGEIE